MIGTIYIKVNAENPNISAKTIYSFKDSPSSLRIIDVPKKIGKWEITRVYLNVTNPNGTLVVQECVRTNGAYVVTFNGCSALGKSSDGYKVLADGKDENGDSVQGYVLAVGDYIVLDGAATLTNDGVKHRINLLESVPTTPSQGDVCLIDNELMIYVGEDWKPFANVPTKVSELTNDRNYATVGDVAVRDNALLNKISTKYSMVESDLVRQNIYGCFWCTKQDCESGDFSTYTSVDFKIAYAYDSATDEDVVWDEKNYGSLTITAQYGNKYKITEPSMDNEVPGKIECILNKVGSTKITIYNLTTGQSAKGLGSVTFKWNDELEVHDGDDTLDSLYPMQNVNFKFPTHMMTLEELINKVIDERINELQ